MYLIVGLGNPGLKYQKTRHNAGFMIVEKISNEKLKKDKKFPAKIAKTKIEGQNVILAAPTTFMNNSGQAVQTIAFYRKIKSKNIIVVHDDIDIPLNKIRIKDKGSAGGHNGVKSIIQHLGAENFIRLKIGIGPQAHNLPSEKYVLQKFSKKELKILELEVIPRALNALQEILKNGPKRAMNKYN